MSGRLERVEGGAAEGLPDRARPLVMRGHPEEQPVLSQSREGEACVSEEGQSFRGREEKEGRTNSDSGGEKK